MRRHRRRPLLPATAARRRHRIIGQTSFFVLIGRTATSLARHAFLYGAIAVVMIALSLVASRYLSLISASLVNQVVAWAGGSVIFAFTLADVDEAPAAQAWARAFERAWAVIVVDFIELLFSSVALGGLRVGNIVDRIAAIMLLLIAISLNFADVDTVVSDDERWWMLVPGAIARSMRATWSSGPLMLRALVLFLVEFVSGNVAGPLWLSVTVATVIFIPVAALTTYVYLDATGYESKRTCSE